MRDRFSSPDNHQMTFYGCLGINRRACHARL